LVWGKNDHVPVNGAGLFPETIGEKLAPAIRLNGLHWERLSSIMRSRNKHEFPRRWANTAGTRIGAVIYDGRIEKQLA
jgi:hypothetical protein